MTVEEVFDAVLEAVSHARQDWLFAGGAEAAIVDLDAGTIRLATREEAAAVLLTRWPADPATQLGVEAMRAEPWRRWVVGTSGDKFVWMHVSTGAHARGPLN